MKKTFLFLMSFMFSIFLCTSVNAFSLGGYQGGIQLDFNGWSTGQNTFDGDFTGTGTGLQDGVEDVWAIGNVSTISTQSYVPLWNGSPSEEITAIIYGADDISYTGNGTNNNIYSLGVDGNNPSVDGFIHLDLYLNVPGTFANVSGQVADRNGYGLYPNVTDGDLFLSMVMVPGWIADDPSTPNIDESIATLYQQASSPTSPASGSGFFYADITGGGSEQLFGRDGFTSLTGQTADVQGEFVFNAGTLSGNDFDNTIRPGSLVGSAVPEPGTLILFGIGLLGLAGIGKKRFSIKNNK